MSYPLLLEKSGVKEDYFMEMAHRRKLLEMFHITTHVMWKGTRWPIGHIEPLID